MTICGSGLDHRGTARRDTDRTPTKPNGSPSEWLCRRRLAVLGRAGGTEKVDEQLRDGLSLVVMDQVRRVGEELEAVEVGYDVVYGQGALGVGVMVEVIGPWRRVRIER